MWDRMPRQVSMCAGAAPGHPHQRLSRVCLCWRTLHELALLGCLLCLFALMNEENNKHVVYQVTGLLSRYGPPCKQSSFLLQACSRVFRTRQSLQPVDLMFFVSWSLPLRQVGRKLNCRVHITEVQDLDEAALPTANPLAGFRIQQPLEAVVIGKVKSGSSSSSSSSRCE